MSFYRASYAQRCIVAGQPAAGRPSAGRPVFATRCAWAILLISFRWSVKEKTVGGRAVNTLAHDDTLFIMRRVVCQRRGRNRINLWIREFAN